MSYNGYRGSGFQYLFNVRRVTFQDHAVGEWRLRNPGEGKTHTRGRESSCAPTCSAIGRS